MADIRTIGGQGVTPAAPARSEAVRAAQRAFFQAALSGAPDAPATPAAPARTAAVRTGAAASIDPPGRLLRPGSIVDIKV